MPNNIELAPRCQSIPILHHPIRTQPQLTAPQSILTVFMALMHPNQGWICVPLWGYFRI